MTTDVLAALPPVPTSLVIAGDTLEISPLKVGELPIFARTIQPLAGKVTADPDWMRLLAEDGETVILAIAVAARRPPEWVRVLELDDAIRLAEALFGANADFFVRRVLPEINRVTGQLSQTLNSVIPGPGSSPAFSGPDTPTPTS